MSEYVDHFALLTEAESLTALRGQVERVVDSAVIVAFPIDPATGLSTVPFGDTSKADALWSDNDGPVWVVISAPGPLTDGYAHFEALATLGPVVHLFNPEDGPAPDYPVRWRMHSIVDGARWSVMVADEPWGDRWINATDAALMAAGPKGVGDGPKALARRLGVSPEAIDKTLTLDGGAAFKALAGIADIYLFDQFVLGPRSADAGVTYFFEMDF